MRTRRVGLGLGILCLMTVTVLGVETRPASACTCMGGRTASDFLAGADAAFVGDVIAARLADPESALPEHLGLGSPRMVFTFDVEEVQKGDVAGRQEVVTWPDEAACGVNF